MAGLGKKTFVASTVLTAADVNGYLMDQSVMFFTSAANRDTDIPSPSTGMVAHIDDGTHWLCHYDGSNWLRTDLEWRTYTPTWAATTTNPTVGGSDTLEGFYRQANDMWHVKIQLTTNGTFVTSGSGQYTFTAPSGVSFPTMDNVNTVGTVHCRYANLGSTAAGNFQGNVVAASGTTVRMHMMDTTAASVSAMAAYMTDTVPDPFAGQCYLQLEWFTNGA